MKKYFKIIALGVAALMILNACSKWVDDLTVDPNNATDAPLTTLITGALVGMIQPHEGEDARLACMWARQFTGSDRQYSAFNTYQVNAENFDWAGLYYSSAQQAKLAISKAEDEGNGFYSGVAKIVRAMSFGNAAALFGDVPFSEANDLVQFPDPAYDAQADVYAGIQTMLDNAITDLSSGSGSDVGGVDFYFNGDASKWIATAYTLKARYYLHVGDYTNADMAAQSGIASSANDMMIPHTGGAYNQDMNLYSSFGEQDRQGYLTANNAYLPSILDSASADYRGNAKTDERLRFDTLYTGTSAADYDLNYGGYWSATSPFPLVTAIENFLIRAEIMARGGDGPGALMQLNNARAELAAGYPTGMYADYDITDFDAGGMEDNGQGTAVENLLYEILEEKYVSLVGQIEVFNDLRRTDNLLGITPTNGATMPERFLYPQEEIDANSNTPSPIPDVFTPTPVNN